MPDTATEPETCGGIAGVTLVIFFFLFVASLACVFVAYGLAGRK